MPMTGAVVCYVGLAYNLYLLEHNVELQERYISRLKNPENFQGAYYELMVAGILIRAGFRLELEDETDQQSKHCEFSAVSLITGRKYWVEAKMRSVEGRFGKSVVDGVPNTVADPTTRLTKHISDALKKPATDERLIFVDLNAEVENEEDTPKWLEQAVRRLDARERDLSESQRAYVFVTNLPFHLYLAGNSPGRQALGYGLGISDFSKPGNKTLIQMYREKQKHLDAHEIMDAIKVYPVFPDTFDGSLISDSSDRNIKIGETYQFTDVGDPPGTIGTVTDAIVMEDQEIAHVVIRTKDGKSLILKQTLTRHQLDDYRKHKDTFFGVKKNAGGQINDPFEFFEWLLTTYKKSSKEKLLEFLAKAPDIELLRSLSQEDLALIYCERIAVQFLHDTKKTGDGK